MLNHWSSQTVTMWREGVCIFRRGGIDDVRTKGGWYVVKRGVDTVFLGVCITWVMGIASV